MRVTNAFPTWHSNSMRTKDKAAPELSLVFAEPVHGAPLETATASLSPKAPKEHRQAKRRRTSEPTAHVNRNLQSEEHEDVKSMLAAETSHSSEDQSTPSDIENGHVEIENSSSENAINLQSDISPPETESVEANSNGEELIMEDANTAERVELPPLSDAQGQNVTIEKQSLKTEPVGEDKHALVTSSSWFFFGRKMVQPTQPTEQQIKADIAVNELTQEEDTGQTLNTDVETLGLESSESTTIKEQPTSHLVPSKDAPISTTPQSSPPTSGWFGPIMNYLSRDSSVAQVGKPTEVDATHNISSNMETYDTTPESENDNNESTLYVAANIASISNSSSTTVVQTFRRPEGSSRMDSSVDDEVPKLSSIGTLQGLPHALSINGRNTGLKTGLPVVGKPKSPSQIVENFEGPKIKGAALESKLTVSTEGNGVGIVNENHKVSSSANDENFKAKIVQSSYTASWWSVLGLGTSNDSGSQENHVIINSPTTTIPEANSSPLISGDSVSASNPENTSSSESQSSTATVTETTVTTVTTRYNPWSWWSTQPSAPNEKTSQPNENMPKTEAEIVKEVAQAREHIPAPESAVRPEISNPVTSTFTTNSKGWMSFLSSRTALIKSTPENDEDGMEVMNIDEDDAPFTDNRGINQRSIEAENNALVLAKQNEPSSGSARNKERGRSDLGMVPPTTSENVKNKVMESKRSSSVSSSKKSVASPTVRPPNLVLPTFDDTFKTVPRSVIPPKPRATSKSTIKKTLGYMADVFLARDQEQTSAKGKERDMQEYGHNLPRSLELLGRLPEHYLPSGGKVVIVGVHGWFPGFAMRTVLGEPTGTSTKFANMMYYAVKGFAEEQGIQFEKITKIPLEGEGIIADRVQKLYDSLTSNEEWMSALHEADAILFSAHSQGTIVSTHLIHKLIVDKHIRMGTEKGSNSSVDHKKGQRVCCLALCGIHLGPLAYLHKSSFVQPYIQYFESAAASELFQFQDTESQVSKEYIKALRFVLNKRVKFVYVASLNDQVVPIYSGACSCANHPLILRALYIDGDAYHSSDFLSNLIVLLFRILNAGLSDAGLLSHLSEATAGSLNGVGHSTVYEELSTYTLAVKYLFLVNNGADDLPDLEFEPFNTRSTLNDYEIPWCLRDLIADECVERLFHKEFAELRDSFDDWQPKTSILRDLKRKLEPIRRLKLTSRL